MGHVAQNPDVNSFFCLPTSLHSKMQGISSPEHAKLEGTVKTSHFLVKTLNPRVVTFQCPKESVEEPGQFRTHKSEQLIFFACSVWGGYESHYL